MGLLNALDCAVHDAGPVSLNEGGKRVICQRILEDSHGSESSLEAGLFSLPDYAPRSELAVRVSPNRKAVRISVLEGAVNEFAALEENRTGTVLERDVAQATPLLP